MSASIRFEPATHTYWLGERALPSVTTILRVARVSKSLDGIPPSVLARARDRGIALHALCEALDRGREIDNDHQFAAWAEHYRRFSARAGLEPIAVEHPLHHPTDFYAGTPDLVTWLGGERWVLDRKATSSVDHAATRAQTAAYARAWNALHPTEPITRLGAIHLRADDCVLHQYDLAVGTHDWLKALDVYRRTTMDLDDYPEELEELADDVLQTYRQMSVIEVRAESASVPALAAPEIEAHAQKDVLHLLHDAESLVIEDAQSAQLAADVIKNCAGARRKIEDWFAPLVESAHSAWKELTERRRHAIAKFAGPEGVARAKLAAYQREADERVRDARRAAIERAQEEAIRKQRLVAEEARIAGDGERARRIEAAPPAITITAHDAPSDAQKRPAGVAFGQKWTAEVVDLTALLRAIVEGKAPATLVKADQANINQLARSLRDSLSIPGLIAKNETIVRALGRRKGAQ